MIDHLSDSLVLPKDDLGEAGAPAREIEITSEMIEAGLSALSHYRYDNSNEEEIVATIFSAMIEARYRKSGHSVDSRLTFSTVL